MEFIVKLDRLLVFLLIAGIVAMLTRRLRVPYSVGLVLMGIILPLFPLFAEVPFTIPFQALISTEIFDKNGNLMYQAYAGSFRAGENTLRINVPIENWEVDDYDLFIMEDLHTTNKKLKLTLKEIQSQE